MASSPSGDLPGEWKAKDLPHGAPWQSTLDTTMAACLASHTTSTANATLILVTKSSSTTSRPSTTSYKPCPQSSYQPLSRQPMVQCPGPNCSTIVYLQEWQPAQLMRWIRPESKLMLASEFTHLSPSEENLEATAQASPGHMGAGCNPVQRRTPAQKLSYLPCACHTQAHLVAMTLALHPTA